MNLFLFSILEDYGAFIYENLSSFCTIFGKLQNPVSSCLDTGFEMRLPAAFQRAFPRASRNTLGETPSDFLNTLVK